MECKPWFLIDVDGVLNPFNAKDPPGYTLHTFHREDKPDLLVWLNADHGSKLLGLTDVFDLAWCTTWTFRANEWISPIIGLPTDLPVIDFGSRQLHRFARPSYELGEIRGVAQVFWKTGAVAGWADKRPFCWIDDDIGDGDRLRLERLGPLVGPHLLIKAHPKVGLLDEHLTEARTWAESL